MRIVKGILHTLHYILISYITDYTGCSLDIVFSENCEILYSGLWPVSVCTTGLMLLGVSSVCMPDRKVADLADFKNKTKC